MTDAAEEQDEEPISKTWEPPELETLDIGSTENGFFAVNFETQFLFRVS